MQRWGFTSACKWFGCAAIVIGAARCAPIDDSDERAARREGDMMPAGTPGSDRSYMADQTQVKLIAEREPKLDYTKTLADFRADNQARAKGGPAPGSQPAEGDSAQASGEGGKDGGGGKGFLSSVGKLFGKKGAGSDSKEPKEQAEARTIELVDAKQAVTEIPANPAGKSGPDVEKARDNAVNAARAELVKAIFAVRLDPTTTIADYVGAENATNLELNAVETVGLKWLDANQLEAEVQVRVSDAANALSAKFQEQGKDFSALNNLDTAKVILAKGTASIKVDDSRPTKALPGERAKRAAETGGI